MVTIMQVSNERMTLAMEWSGQKAFAAKPLQEWMVDDHVAGLTRHEGLLTFATLYGAGHFVGAKIVGVKQSAL